MNRILIMIATVGFILAVGCFAAAGLAGAGSWNQAWRWGPGWTLGGDDGPWTGGPVITRQYRWDGGDSLRIDAPADLDYTQGPLISLAITGPKALLDRLTVQDGRIGYNGWVSGGPALKIVMTAPTVSHFASSGSQRLSIANYSQDALAVAISGSGDVVAKGQARQTTLRISGSGNGDLSGLTGEAVTVEISGSGGAAIAPTTSADVRISGSGHVALLTHPPDVNTQISGSGSVVQSRKQ